MKDSQHIRSQCQCLMQFNSSSKESYLLSKPSTRTLSCKRNLLNRTVRRHRYKNIFAKLCSSITSFYRRTGDLVESAESSSSFDIVKTILQISSSGLVMSSHLPLGKTGGYSWSLEMDKIASGN